MVAHALAVDGGILALSDLILTSSPARRHEGKAY